MRELTTSAYGSRAFGTRRHWNFACRRAVACLSAALFSLIANSARAVPCPECFAVMLWPDTQDYTRPGVQPTGGDHFELMGRWACAFKDRFFEPSTGKEMPIVFVQGLGDIVMDWHKATEYAIADAAYGQLDACGIPYLAIAGNHDTAGAGGAYYGAGPWFEQFFGNARYAPYACPPSGCTGQPGFWYHTNPTFNEPNTRNWLQVDTEGTGPPFQEESRHRAALISVPNGQKWLFLGLDMGFDYPPVDPGNVDDTLWPKSVLASYPGVHTVLTSHAMAEYSPPGISKRDQFRADSFANSAGTDDGGIHGAWVQMGRPDQVVVAAGGHFTGCPECAESDTDTDLTASGLPVYAIFRNWQCATNDELPYVYGNACGDGVPEATNQLNGWNTIMVFDPAAQEIRIRSYRINDTTPGDQVYTGVPEAAANLDMDYNGRPEVRFSYAFPDARPEWLDNCPGVPNPDQEDSDDDGIGDACEQSEVCGDGIVTPGETCDDSGMTPGDGCDATCQVEPGWSCAGEPSVCSVVCGDGIISGGEACDDFGTAPGDGCDANCQVESGWSCVGAPSVCTFVCGNGVVDPSETCDDSGTTSDDGCDSTCQVEPGFVCSGEPSVCESVGVPALAPTALIGLAALLLGVGAALLLGRLQYRG